MEITTGLRTNMVAENLLPRYRQYLLDIYGGTSADSGWRANPG